MDEQTPTLSPEQARRLRERFERTATSLKGMLKSAPTLTRNLVSNERTRAMRLEELDTLLTELDDARLASERDLELYGWLERWQKLGADYAARYRAGCRHLPAPRSAR